MTTAHDRALALAGLGVVAVLCWTWIAFAAADMQRDMRGAAAWMMPAQWSSRYALLIFAMWAVMMIAMMLPSAAPVALLYQRVAGSDGQVAHAALRLYAFTAGYLSIWCLFSLAATGLQWALSASNLLSPMMRVRNDTAVAALLIAAGTWQWSPLKQRCLRHCSSPAEFIAREWRAGTAGAWQMGLRLGVYCLGCCWAMMLLLFVGGVMSFAWIVAISLVVLLEKFLPWGANASRVFGAALTLAGFATLAFPR
ncbi:MAG: DUF2182 domain-containing protein [Proteobacteria bacterium]|uniref:DUF2182 domain-containing protein n=1 Tax=Rudaea sp. TaxID=2136325 RepID=UPI00321FD6D9|nr:DUF2182 domain-containing protein [Pseudomonadota bacterium]